MIILAVECPGCGEKTALPENRVVKNKGYRKVYFPLLSCRSCGWLQDTKDYLKENPQFKVLMED